MDETCLQSPLPPVRANLICSVVGFCAFAHVAFSPALALALGMSHTSSCLPLLAPPLFSHPQLNLNEFADEGQELYSAVQYSMPPSTGAPPSSSMSTSVTAATMKPSAMPGSVRREVRFLGNTLKLNQDTHPFCPHPRYTRPTPRNAPKQDTSLARSRRARSGSPCTLSLFPTRSGSTFTRTSEEGRTHILPPRPRHHSLALTQLFAHQ